MDDSDGRRRFVLASAWTALAGWVGLTPGAKATAAATMSAASKGRTTEHVYREWHEAMATGDLDRVIALYAENAVIETPVILALDQDARSGVATGKANVRAVLEMSMAGLKGLYRPPEHLADETYLSWEYPRITPNGSQIGVFEAMDIENGLIVYHRVYWAWDRVLALLDRRPGISGGR